jgi:hypothetical protein
LIPQPFPLDRTGGLPYYPLAAAAAVLVVGCTGLTSFAPANLAPIAADSVAQWVRALQPGVPLHYDLRWRFENDNGRAAGRAAVRFAPPDTLRFDYRGPFGRSGSALVVGDEAVWAEPEGDFRSLIPVAPVLWASLGIVVPAPDGAALLGMDEPARRAWRYAYGDEELDFIHERDTTPRLLAELRRAGRIVGVAEVALASDSGPPTAAAMRFPRDRSRFFLTVQRVDTVPAFGPETWRRP